MSVRTRAVGIRVGCGVAAVAGLVLTPSAAPGAVAAPAAAAVSAASAASAVPASDGDGPQGFTFRDSRITESSGLAASRTHKGVYWTHNDSDDGPYVYAVDGRTGKTVATVTLRGINPRDVEAISVGPDGDVYVGDIGDNLGGTWPNVWIYRFHEPKRLGDTTVTPTRYNVRYAGGARDAESLMVHPKTGRVYIASKNGEGKGGLYAGPERLAAQGVNTFSRVAKIDLQATDGAFSPDGKRLVLRAYFGATAYRWEGKGVSGGVSRIGTVPLPIQRQGEAVTFAPDGRTLMYGSEGARSEVEPVRLSGDAVPPSAEDGSGGSGDDGKGGGAGDSAGEDGLFGADRPMVWAGATFAGALVLWLGLRRVFRRRD
ncbi:hypothetical protein [Streptomyces sp. NBC_01187]|uniref:hypothetical protein n=1 Tax=Streptomyces sp. NBC_01187 TaxID=2903766 RepID=UPI00386D2B26|nr:hypothetical protein OG220_17355 [Streptomyces sp. NBC_01187]